jgi:hypothetical protein
MTKRKRDDKTKATETPAAAVLYEKWDTDALAHIWELCLDFQTEAVVKKVAIAMRHPDANMHRAVTYTAREFAERRVYGQGLQGCSGWIRRMCTYKFYHDIDIVNCGPVLLSQILEKKTGTCPALIKEYAHKRESIFHRLREEEPELKDAPDKSLKDIFLVGAHGGKHTNHFPSIGLLPTHQPIPLLVAWEKAVRDAMEALMRHNDYKEMVQQLTDMKDKKNKVGTFTSWVWQQAENQIILALSKYLPKNENLTPGVLVFDGIMVERRLPYPALLDEAVLRRCEAFVNTTLGFVIRLTEKPLTPTTKDWERYYGEKNLHRIKTDDAKQYYLLARQGQLHGYKRQGGFLVKPHATIPGVFCQADEDSVFINRVLKPYHLFRGACMSKLQLWFNCVDHPKFELLTPTKMNRSVISFLNGFLNIDTLQFELWENVETPPLTDHYFEQELEMSTGMHIYMDKPTPLWDYLLETQLGPRPKCSGGKSAASMRGDTLLCTGCVELEGEQPRPDHTVARGWQLSAGLQR